MAGMSPTPLQVPLVFVLGGARSGTTLVGRLLGSHPRVLHLGETHFFETVWAGILGPGVGASERQLRAAGRATLELFGRYGFERGQAKVEAALTEKSLLASAARLGGGGVGLFRAFASLLAGAEGKAVFCDDTPKHVFYLDIILQEFPEARVVACVRDPRDYLSSYKYYWRRSRESERVRAIYHPVNTSFLWRSTWLALREKQSNPPDSRLLLNRYEDLVQDPELQVRRMCAFLQLDYDPAMLSVQGSNTSFEEGQEGVFATSIGRYQKSLTNEEIWIAQRINGGTMDDLGYARERCQPRWSGVFWLILTALPASLRGLYANRNKRGPLLPYLRRRLRRLLG